MDHALTTVAVPPRTIVPPSTISEEARRALSNGAAEPSATLPAATDHDAWRELVAQMEEMSRPFLSELLARCAYRPVTSEIGGVTCYTTTPTHVGEGTFGGRSER